VKDLSQLATSVMREVEQGQLVKQASATYTNTELETATGKLLQKLAEQVRIEGSAGISYADLARFRKVYDV
jgi:hypothetical protein